MSRLQSAMAWAFWQAALPSLHSAPEQAPVVFWASDPIRPGETALVIGERFGQGPTVEVARLEDPAEIMQAAPTWPGKGQKATALQAGERSVKFVIPGDFQPGVFAYRLTGPGGAAVGLLNRPEVWWTQGDLGPSASPGGWLRVFGKNLGWDKGRGTRDEGPESEIIPHLSSLIPHLLLRGPKTVTLPAEADCYTARVALPKDLPVGEYCVYVHNGCGGGAAWSEPVKIPVEKPRAWPPPPLAKGGAGGVFNVKDCGADGTGEKDDTAAVQAALARAQENGGGVVYFPRGRYQVSETLTIPRFTVLRGEGREQVNLFWPDTETPLPALVRGTNSFGLEDLTLYASNYGHVIVGDTGDKPEAGNVFLRRLRVRGVLYRGHPTAQQVHDRFVAFQKLSSGGGDTVQLGGDNLEITDCDLYGSGRSFVLGWARGALLSGNTFYNGRWGWYDIYNSEQVIFEHNQIIGADLMSTGGGLSCWQTTRPYQQNIYFGHNTFQNMHGWDREAMTSDGGGGAYYGAVGDATADTLFLPAGEKWHAQDLVGMTCFVLGGRGQGQWRTVVRADERSTGLDRPWEVVPDRTSLVGVVMTHRHYLLVGNEFTDCGIAIQFYGTALEHLVAGNRCTRGGGFHSIGKQYGGYDFPPEKSPAHQPDWFVQFLDNEILEGNCYRYNANNAALAGESHVGVYGWASRSGWPWPYNLGAVVRRNHLHNNAHVEVSGACAEVVVENNRIERADAGVVVDGGRGVLLRGNQFAEVRAPYTGAALPQAYLSPMERTEGQLEALRTLLQGAGLREDPAQWPEVKALLREGEAPAEPREGEAPAEPREGEAPAEPSEAAERSRQILTTALAHVARLCPDGLPLQSLAPLLGLRLEVAPESPLHEVIQSGRGGTGELTLRVSAPADGLPLPVGAQVQTPAGWTVERTPEPVPLKPGEAVPLTIPLTIPPGTWGSHELPVTLGLAVGGETLRLHSRVPVGSGFLRDWMVIGPFPNKTGSPLDLTLHPPDDGVDLRAEYDGLKGKVRWQPVHVTGTPLDLRALLQTAEPAVAYTVACVEAEGETPAVLRLGSSGGVALLLNGQPLWSVDQSRAAAPDQDRLPLTLRAGDNVLLFKVCTASDPWQFIAELAPPPGGSLIAPPQSPPTLGGRGAGAGGWGSRLRVVPPEEFAGRAAFAPPPPRPSLPEGGEVKHAGGVNWQPLYADDFERGALGARWRAARGTWIVENGAATARDVAFLAYAEPISAPLRIEYDARARTPGDLSAFWLDDPADYGTGYLMGFGSNGNTVDKVLIHGEQVATSPKPLVEPGRWHHVIAQILPTGRVQIIVDDQMALDHPAPPPPAGPKFAGLWVWGPQGEFDNVRIYTGPAGG